MKRRILIFLGVFFSFSLLLTPLQQPALAAEGNKVGKNNCGAKPTELLGFRAWFHSLCDGGEIVQPEPGQLKPFIWTIVLNILFDIILAIGYLAIGFTIYSGYLYMSAQGEPGRLMRAKKSLSSAVIGTVIAMLGATIVHTFLNLFNLTAGGFLIGENKGIHTSEVVFDSILPFVYSAAGSVAVVFIIRSGVEYMISRGDLMRTKKATAGLAQAIIGLIVVLIAAGITYFVSSTINKSLSLNGEELALTLALIRGVS